MTPEKRAECQMESQKVERYSKEGETAGRQSSWRKGTLELKLNLERWVGMTQGSSGGGCFRKSNKKQAERGREQ